MSRHRCPGRGPHPEGPQLRQPTALDRCRHRGRRHRPTRLRRWQRLAPVRRPSPSRARITTWWPSAAGLGWSSEELEGNGRCYSAPSLRENVSDATRPVEIAFQSASNSLTLLFYNAGSPTPGWENDVITRANGVVDSAPALFDRTANPAGQADLAFQGKGDTLWYYHAPKPPAAGLAPSFTGVKIGGPGSTFGGRAAALSVYRTRLAAGDELARNESAESADLKDRRLLRCLAPLDPLRISLS